MCFELMEGGFGLVHCGYVYIQSMGCWNVSIFEEKPLFCSTDKSETLVIKSM